MEKKREKKKYARFRVDFNQTSHIIYNIFHLKSVVHSVNFVELCSRGIINSNFGIDTIEQELFGIGAGDLKVTSLEECPRKEFQELSEVEGDESTAVWRPTSDAYNSLAFIRQPNDVVHMAFDNRPPELMAKTVNQCLEVICSPFFILMHLDEIMNPQEGKRLWELDWHLELRSQLLRSSSYWMLKQEFVLI